MTSTDSCGLIVAQGHGMQTWHLNFAPVNAIGPEMLAALESALDAATADADTAVVVLTSGLRVFSAGADATWMREQIAIGGPAGLLAEFNRIMDRFRELCLRLRRSDLLVVAAIGGHTLAGGLELAAACDLRFVADNERIQLGVPEMELFGALPSGGGGVQFLTRLLGPSRALRFILDGTPCSPAAALTLGLVDGVYPAESVVADTVAFAERVAAKAGRVGVAAAKRAVLGGAELPLYEALEVDRSVHWDAMRRGNFLGGVENFVAKFASGASR